MFEFKNNIGIELRYKRFKKKVFRVFAKSLVMIVIFFSFSYGLIYTGIWYYGSIEQYKAELRGWEM